MNLLLSLISFAPLMLFFVSISYMFFALGDIYVYPRLMAWIERNEVATQIGFEYPSLNTALSKEGVDCFDTFASTPRRHINRLDICLGLDDLFIRCGETGIAAVISAETLHMVTKKIGQWDANDALDDSDMHSLIGRYQEFADEGYGLMLPQRLK